MFQTKYFKTFIIMFNLRSPLTLQNSEFRLKWNFCKCEHFKELASTRTDWKRTFPILIWIFWYIEFTTNALDMILLYVTRRHALHLFIAQHIILYLPLFCTTTSNIWNHQLIKNSIFPELFSIRSRGRTVQLVDLISENDKNHENLWRAYQKPP